MPSECSVAQCFARVKFFDCLFFNAKYICRLLSLTATGDPIMIFKRKLRIYQIVCLLFALQLPWLVLRRPVHPASNVLTWSIICCTLAIYSAWLGFWAEKLFRRVGRRPDKGLIPLKTWKQGHLVRLASALSVCLWGFVLGILGGAPWLVYPIFALGTILLVIWRPGSPLVELES